MKTIIVEEKKRATSEEVFVYKKLLKNRLTKSVAVIADIDLSKGHVFDKEGNLVNVANI